MSMQAWLRSLSEETLVSWANRGLFRRAQKLLEGEEPQSWLLEEGRAQAELDGHRQQLAGVGFEHLQCSCPAFGICHHQLCLLLGLHARLTVASVEGNSNDNCAPVPMAEPWLVLDVDERLRLLGRPALTRAQRWLAQGVEAQLTVDDRLLLAVLDGPQQAEVMIPRAGGLPASLCSCRESRCAHRALVILQLAQAADPDSDLIASAALSNTQLQTLTALDHWLAELAAVGVSGGSSLFVARGEALATELLQADLPLPGRVLGRLVHMLDDERLGMAGSHVRLLRQQLAELLAYRRALARTPLPQPLPQLAGVHRRRFVACEGLPLFCLAAECWETASGYQGYSLHFVSPQDGRCYSLSEARVKSLNPLWRAEEALAQATFAGQAAIKLLGMHCLLERGWVSEEGRLSNREGTRLQVLGAWSQSALLAMAETPATRLHRIADHRSGWLYRGDPQSLGLVAAKYIKGPAFERLTQRWLGEAHGMDGSQFRIALAASPASARAVRILQQAEKDTVWLFGRWSIENDLLCLTPIALLDGRGLQQLFSEVVGV